MVFFRWDDNVLHILFQSDKRSGFQIIESAICNKVLNKLSGPWVLLNLVKDD